MSEQIRRLLAIAKELEGLSPRKQICERMKQFYVALVPLLLEHGIEEQSVVPPATRTFDPELKHKLTLEVHKAVLAEPGCEKQFLERVYALFVEMQNQYCVSTRQLQAA